MPLLLPSRVPNEVDARLPKVRGPCRPQPCGTLTLIVTTDSSPSLSHPRPHSHPRYDADRSGDLDLIELRTALIALGLRVDVPEAAAVLAKYDTDVSGRLELDAFARLVQQLRDFQQSLRDRPTSTSATDAATHRPPPSLPAPEARTIFERFHLGSSGSISYVELRSALRALGLEIDIPQAEQLLAKFDADASGRLDLDECQTVLDQLRLFESGAELPTSASGKPLLPPGIPSSSVTPSSILSTTNRPPQPKLLPPAKTPPSAAGAHAPPLPALKAPLANNCASSSGPAPVLPPRLPPGAPGSKRPPPRPKASS